MSFRWLLCCPLLLPCVLLHCAFPFPSSGFILYHSFTCLDLKNLLQIYIQNKNEMKHKKILKLQKLGFNETDLT